MPFRKLFFGCFLLTICSGVMFSCGPIYKFDLKPGERIVITKEVNSKTKPADNDDQTEEEQTDHSERENHFFGTEQDLMRMQKDGKPKSGFYKNDIVIGAGFTKIYGDLKYTDMEPAYRLLYNRYLKRNFTIGVSFHHGAFSEYEKRNSWTDGLQMYNRFTAVSVNSKISIGNKASRNNSSGIIRGMYLGIGAGLIFSDITDISTKFKQQDQRLITQVFPSSINTNSSIFYIPFDAGINYTFAKRFLININCQFGYAFSDELDGYNFQGGVKNKFSDMFSIVSFGIGYRFGK